MSAEPIRIGIIGAGTVGQTLAQLWIKSGHPVMISSRHPDDIRSLAQRLGAQVGSPEDAARYGEVIVTAVPYGSLPDVGKATGQWLSQKVVIDPSNPYPGRDGKLAEEALSSSSGQVSARVLGAPHLVRAFNNLAMSTLAAGSDPANPLAIPLASDDKHAIQVVSQLIKDAGFIPVVAGDLKQSHRFDPNSDLFLTPMNARELENALKP